MSHSKLEKRLEKISGLDALNELVRVAIESNPFPSGTLKHTSWREQCLVNFPLLYLASLELFQYGSERECDTYLFATRDGCHWHRIFQALFPACKAHYFHCSRNMLERATHHKNDAYDAYVASLASDPARVVYVDIHGTGKRMFNYFSRRWNKVPHCFLLTAVERSMDTMPGTTRKWAKRDRVRVLEWGMRGGPIEMLNYDLVGTLQNYSTRDGPVRDRLEYPQRYVKPHHACIDFLVARLQPIQADAFSTSGDDVRHLIRRQCDLIARQKPAIAQHIEHVVKHEKS